MAPDSVTVLSRLMFESNFSSQNFKRLFGVPTSEAEADFNAWYNEEHVPALARVPGCLSARRFRIHHAVSDGNHRYLALYHLTSPEVCSSTDWKKAVEMPWTHRIRPQTRGRMRIVLRRYVRKTS